MKERKEQMKEILKELTATFLARESNNTSLITVTDANISPDFKNATVFITVMPTNKEEEVLNFTKRQGKHLREYLKKNMHIKIIPFITVAIDKGEKNRQRIDELLREK